jgi:hypothetical protein
VAASVPQVGGVRRMRLRARQILVELEVAPGVAGFDAGVPRRVARPLRGRALLRLDLAEPAQGVPRLQPARPVRRPLGPGHAVAVGGRLLGTPMPPRTGVGGRRLDLAAVPPVTHQESPQRPQGPADARRARAVG